MAGNLSTHDEEVLNHYECFFGRTHELYEFAAIPEPGISPLFVAEFPESEDRDWTYATIGMR